MLSASEQYQQYYNRIKGSFVNYSRDVMMHSHLYDDLTGLPEYYKASQLKKRQMFEIAVHANQMFLDRIMEETIGFEAARESNEEEEDEGSENVYENYENIGRYNNITNNYCENAKESEQFKVNTEKDELYSERYLTAQRHFSVNSTAKRKQLYTLITTASDYSKIKTTLKQFFREWCSESNYKYVYTRISNKCEQYLQKGNLILVPGCGLGRLLVDLVSKGFGAQGNYVTYFMLYGSNFILNCVTQKYNYTIYPFIHGSGYINAVEDIYCPVKIPDIVATYVVPDDSELSIVAGNFTYVYRQRPNAFEGVATCFFLDTANNIFEYVDVIHLSLKRGGVWVNLGPLLYHYHEIYNEVSVEVSWETLRKYIVKRFDIVEEQFVETTYCHDPMAKMLVKYRCIEFVARKKVDY